MSSDPFELLGLNPRTATDGDVRRAYAERLKMTRPEDDREGFMALRAAFEAARNQVRWRGEPEEENYEQDHSPPDEYGQSSAETGRPPVQGMAEIEPYKEDDGAETEEAPEDEADEDYDDYHPSPEEIAAWAPIKAALDRLTDVLTASGEPPPVKAVLAVIDADEISGIDQFQTMRSQVQQFICQRTNGFNRAAGMRVPDWLSLDVFDALDTYYGWTRDTTTNSYYKDLNDWMLRLRRAIEMEAAPARERNQAELEDAAAGLFGPKDPPAETGRGGKGSTIWLWIGAGILISQLVQFLVRISGGG